MEGTNLRLQRKITNVKMLQTYKWWRCLVPSKISNTYSVHKRNIDLCSRLISNISSFVCGGARLVFDAWQMSLALRCCRPMLGNVRLLTVTPSSLNSYESSINVFSRYHIKLGRGSPRKNKIKLLIPLHLIYAHNMTA